MPVWPIRAPVAAPKCRSPWHDDGVNVHAVSVPMTPIDFVSRVRAADPRLNAVVDEHLADNDELLPHLLVADLRRCAEAAHESEDFDLRDIVLTLMDSALADADEALDNAVAVSFVEDSAWWETGKEEFLEAWPSTLTDELNRQRVAGS